MFDCNGDGRPDLLLGGYGSENPLARGMQLLVNAGNRKFVDETRQRIGESAWSPTESWHQEHRVFDDTGHYVALKSTEFKYEDADALGLFAWGTKVRVRIRVQVDSVFRAA